MQELDDETCKNKEAFYIMTSGLKYMCVEQTVGKQLLSVLLTIRGLTAGQEQGCQTFLLDSCSQGPVIT